MSLLLLSVTISCSKQQLKTFSEYAQWLNDPENGLIKTKYVNGIELKVKYLPAEYLAYRELNNENNYTPVQRDSVFNLYKNSISILLSLGPDERKGTSENIIYRSMTTYQEYSQRVYDMNFMMEEYVTISAGENEYRPVLSQMENTYEASAKRNIILVFTPQAIDDNSLSGSDELKIKYADMQFDLGTNYFVFKREDINKIPSINFWKS